jgi:hypothetical protein
MKPMMRFSMGSEPFAEAEVEGAGGEESHHQHDEQQVVHVVRVRLNVAFG